MSTIARARTWHSRLINATKSMKKASSGTYTGEPLQRFTNFSHEPLWNKYDTQEGLLFTEGLIHEMRYNPKSLEHYGVSHK